MFALVGHRNKVDGLSMYLTLICRKRELTLAMQRVETIKKCDLREIVTLFRHVVNLQVSLCKYGFFVMFLICYHYFQWILEGVSKGGQWGVSRGSVDRGSVFCRSPSKGEMYFTTSDLYKIWLYILNSVKIVTESLMFKHCFVKSP